jgi:hypothetical protein
MRKLRWNTLLVALCAVAGFAATSGAQITTGSIAGRIVDGSGNPIEGVRVQVKSAATGVVRAVPSNAEGRYYVLGLEAAEEYAVTAQKIGFAPITKEKQTVSLGQITRVDFILTAQATQLQAVAVQGAQDPIITPSKNGIGTTISESAINKLPTLNRNFTDFATTAPQVSSQGPGLSGGGANNRYNNIQIDGSTEKDLFGLGSTGQPGGQAGGKSIGIESVKQYQILLSPYDVRYGNFSGLLINAVTKSGSNQFTGSAYTYYRDSSETRAQPYLGWYHQAQSGFSLGGPIWKDKVFFFVNPEWQSQGNPASGQFVGGPYTATQIPLQSDITRVKNFLNPLGFQVGDGSQRGDLNPLTNIFARLDFTDLPFNSTLTLRENYGHAALDVFSRTLTSSTFPLTDNGFTYQSDKSAWVAQLKSAFNNGSYNELYLGITHIRDARVTFVPNNLPMVQVRTSTAVTVTTGAERSSQLNQLDQDVFELTDNYTIPVGNDHRITFGTQNQWYKIRNLFGQNSSGYWQFNSLDSLTGACAACAGNPLATSYQVGVAAQAGTDGAVRFHQQTSALYIQDEWTPTSRLTVSYGVRADVSLFTEKPPFNQGVSDTLHRNTSDIPSGNWQISPRVGFNWDITGDSRNQLRGGYGIFTGQPAFVWLSNSFQNSGLSGYAQLTCNTAVNKAPAFNQAAVNNPPTACAGSGLTAAAGSEVDLARKDLKFPQSERYTLGYDRDLGKGYVWTAEVLYTRGLNQLFYQNIALAGPQGVDSHGRVMYGPAPLQPVKVGGTYNPVTATSVGGYSRTQVYEISNESKDYSYQLTTGITRRYRNNFEASLFYTYSKVRDVQSVTSSTSISQYQFGKSYGTTPESAQDLGTSIFEVPHRLVGSMTYTFQPTGTDISLIYIGESGQRIHYTYGGSSSGDLNGDGIGNDMIYIPKNVRDPAEIQFANLSGFTIAQQQDALEAFINGHKCLKDQEGSIMGRDSCGEPFHHTFNFSLRQSIGGLLGSVWKGGRTSRLHDLTVQWDVFNLANLINNNWGLYESSGFAGATNLISYSGKAAGSMLTKDGGAQPTFTFSPTFTYTSNQNVNSNYRMQFSIRYSF